MTSQRSPDGPRGRLGAGDRLPSFTFAAAGGSAWSSDAHLSAGAGGVPLVLILHRHLA